jgi:hypothetical protein
VTAAKYADCVTLNLIQGPCLDAFVSLEISSWEHPFTSNPVIPAKAGIHEHGISRIEFPDFSYLLKLQCSWIPAFAGMTGEKEVPSLIAALRQRC